MKAARRRALEQRNFWRAAFAPDGEHGFRAANVTPAEGFGPLVDQIDASLRRIPKWVVVTAPTAAVIAPDIGRAARRPKRQKADVIDLS